MTEAAAAPAAAPKEAISQAVEFAREELTGKLMAVIVSQLEKIKTTWSTTPEKKQNIAIGQIEEAVTKAVEDAARTIMTDRQPAIVAMLKSVTFEEGVKATLSLGNTDASHILANHARGNVWIVLSPPTYTLGGHKVKGQPDQKALPIGESAFDIVADADRFVIRKDKMPVAGCPESFQDRTEALAWIKEHENAQAKAQTPETPPTAATEAKDPPAVPAQQHNLPSVRAFEDGFVCYDAGGHAMCGGRKFPDQQQAEAWLQQFLEASAGKGLRDGPSTGQPTPPPAKKDDKKPGRGKGGY